MEVQFAAYWLDESQTWQASAVAKYVKQFGCRCSQGAIQEVIVRVTNGAAGAVEGFRGCTG